MLIMRFLIAVLVVLATVAPQALTYESPFDLPNVANEPSAYWANLPPVMGPLALSDDEIREAERTITAEVVRRLVEREHERRRAVFEKEMERRRLAMLWSGVTSPSFDGSESVADAEQWWRWFRPKRIIPPVPDGPTFYVRTDGANGPTTCNGTVNVADSAPVRPNCAWQTMNYAVDNVTAGDTVRVQAGTYSELLTPGDAGTLANPITYVADGSVTFCGMQLTNGINYLRFIGFTIDTDAGTCVKANHGVSHQGTSTGIEFWNVTIRDVLTNAFRTNSVSDRAHNWIFVGVVATEIGPCLEEDDVGPLCPAAPDPGGLLGGGNSNGAVWALRGNDNFFGYNHVTRSDPDIWIVFGARQYYFNNWTEMHVTDDGHGDVWQENSSALGNAWTVREGNFVLGKGTIIPGCCGAGEHGALMQDQSADGSAACGSGPCGENTENLFRWNVHHNSAGSGTSADSAASGGITNTRMVHETWVDMMRQSPSTPYTSNFRFGSNNAYVLNNINDDAWTPSVSTNIETVHAQDGASITAFNGNLAHESGVTLTFHANWNAQTSKQSNADPAFNNRASDDFTIGASSAAKDNGVAITTTSGSGTGTTFNVQTGFGGFFRGPNINISQYGGNLTAGDVITIGSDTRTVVSVSGDAITVDSSFTWADADPVYYGTDTTPDIGAYPHKAGGYTLTATYSGSSTITVTPNDASLVRFVVCFNSNVPYAVDNSSPYTCTAPAGTFSARVYKRYASQDGSALWAVATP